MKTHQRCPPPHLTSTTCKIQAWKATHVTDCMEARSKQGADQTECGSMERKTTILYYPACVAEPRDLWSGNDDIGINTSVR